MGHSNLLKDSHTWATFGLCALTIISKFVFHVDLHLVIYLVHLRFSKIKSSFSNIGWQCWYERLSKKPTSKKVICLSWDLI